MPGTLEMILRLAAKDRTFRKELLEERTAAVKAIGVELDDSERAVLESCDRETLQATIEHAEKSPSAPVRLASDRGGLTLGIQPDPVPPPTRGISTDLPDELILKPATGIRPDVPPRGSK